MRDSDGMEITVKLYGVYKEHAGTESIRVKISEEETVDTLLLKLSRRYPKVVEDVLDPTTGDLRDNCNIMLNGRRIQQIRGIHTKLKHKDEVTLAPPDEAQGSGQPQT